VCNLEVLLEVFSSSVVVVWMWVEAGACVVESAGDREVAEYISVNVVLASAVYDSDRRRIPGP
jgi:hypothetical protein